MFENVGKKIKTVTQIFFWISVIGSFAGAIAMFSMANEAYYEETQILFAIIAFVLLIAGPVISWLSCLCLYGFGELVDKAQENTDNIKYQTQSYRKKEEAQKLLKEGLISLEEYKRIVGE